MMEFSIKADFPNQVLMVSTPKRFAPPNQSFNRIAAKCLIFAVYRDSVLAARLDFYLAARKRRQFRGRAMRTPITHHEHLHRRRRVPGNGEELGRSNSLRPFIADTHADVPLVYFYC